MNSQRHAHIVIAKFFVLDVRVMCARDVMNA